MLEFLVLFFAGLLVATYDAVVGSGGLLMVTSFSIMGIPLLPAIGTMRFVTLLQEGVSAYAFSRKLDLNRRAIGYYGLLAAVFGALGSMITFRLNEQLLSLVVGIFLFGLLFILPKLRFEERRDLSNPLVEVQSFFRKLIKPKQQTLNLSINRKNVLLTLLCAGLCIYGGFYGAGFGTIALFPFVTVGGMGLLRSAAYARFLGFFMSLTATTVYLGQGAIDWSLFVPLGLGTMIGSWVGVQWAVNTNLSWLRHLLTVVLVLASIDLILKGVGVQLF